MRLPEGTRSLTALSSRFEPQVLGTSAQIVHRLSTLGVEWISVEHRTLGVVRNDLFVLEIELPVGPVDHVVLTLHGEHAVDAARGVLDVLDASAVDLDTDLVVDLGAPASRRQAKQSLDFACA